MKISVVVPVYNARQTLPQCIEALLSQEYPGFEIILVDNNSTDGSYEIMKHLTQIHHDRICLVRELRQGPSTARNRGAGQATGDIIAFTDSDCVPDTMWLRRIAEGFDHDNIGAVAGAIKGYVPSHVIEKFLCLFTLRSPIQSQEFSSFTLVQGGFPTANLAVRKELLQKICGFDEQMEIYSEDFDLCARIYQQGRRIRYAADAVVYHIHRHDMKGLIRQSFGFGRGHARLLQKCFRHRVIVEIPRLTIEKDNLPVKLWLNCASADKKLLFFLLFGFLFSPLFSLVPLYLCYLYYDITGRASQEGVITSLRERITMVALLLVKSFAMTSGRIYGSFKYKVLCF